MARMTQSEKNEAYRKERRKLQQNVRRMKKRGYDVSNIQIPKIPTDRKIRQSDINELKKINKNRYEKASYTTVIYGANKKHEREPQRKTYTGKKAQTMARRESARKAANTRKAKDRIRKNYPYASKAEIDWRYDFEKRISELENAEESTSASDDDYGFDDSDFNDNYTGDEYSDDAVWDPINHEWVEPTLDINTDDYDYFEDRETGEIYEFPKGSKNPDPSRFSKVLPSSDRGEKIYDDAISQLEIMEEYEGDPGHGRDKKHDETTRENASRIKDLLKRLHDENPDALSKALDSIGDDLLTTDVKYYKGGYNALAFKIAQALAYNGYDIMPSEYGEGDYDEGNYYY